MPPRPSSNNNSNSRTTTGLAKKASETFPPLISDEATLLPSDTVIGLPPPYTPIAVATSSFSNSNAPQTVAAGTASGQDTAAAINRGNQSSEFYYHPASFPGYTVVQVATGQESQPLLPRVVRFRQRRQRNGSGGGCCGRLCARLCGYMCLVVLVLIALSIIRGGLEYVRDLVPSPFPTAPPSQTWSCSAETMVVHMNEAFWFPMDAPLRIDSTEGINLSRVHLVKQADGTQQVTVRAVVETEENQGAVWDGRISVVATNASDVAGGPAALHAGGTRNSSLVVRAKRPHWGWPYGCIRTTLYISIPETNQLPLPLLYVRTATGTLSAVDLGALHARAVDLGITNGNAIVRNISIAGGDGDGLLSIHTTNGAIRMRGVEVVDGRIRMETSNEIISIEDVAASRVTATTSNAPIRGSVAVRDAAVLGTTNGAVDVNVRQQRTSDVLLRNSKQESLRSASKGAVVVDVSSSNAPVSVNVAGIGGSFLARTSNSHTQVTATGTHSKSLQFTTATDAMKQGTFVNDRFGADDGEINVVSSNATCKRSALTVWTLTLILMAQASVGSCDTNSGDKGGGGVLQCLGGSDKQLMADIQASSNYHQDTQQTTSVVAAGTESVSELRRFKYKVAGNGCNDEGNNSGSGSDSDSDSDCDEDSAGSKHATCTTINVNLSLVPPSANGCGGNGSGNTGYATPYQNQYQGQQPAGYQTQQPATYQGQQPGGYQTQQQYQTQRPAAYQTQQPGYQQPQQYSQPSYQNQQQSLCTQPPPYIRYPEQACTLEYQHNGYICTTHAGNSHQGNCCALATEIPRPARLNHFSNSNGGGEKSLAWTDAENYDIFNSQVRHTADPRAATHNRPEVGEESTAPSSTTDSAGENAEDGGNSSGWAARPVDINDPYRPRLLRPTKTAELPELLDRTPQPPMMLAPEPEQAQHLRVQQQHGTAVRSGELDPLTPGGVDLYPAIAERDLKAPADAPGKIEEEVWRLVESLTVEEKAGQMTQIHVDLLVDAHSGGANMTAVEHWIDRMKVGAVVGWPGESSTVSRFAQYSPQRLANLTSTVQQVALARGSRVPLLWTLEAAHGAAPAIKRAAMFPAPVALAASWQPMCAYAAGRVAAKDLRAAGYQCAVGPSADLAVEKKRADAALGFGEDPTLAAAMAAHSVRGFQGDYKSDRARVACCVRNFVAGTTTTTLASSNVGGGAGLRRFHQQQAAVPDRQLFEYHLPPFEAAMRVGGAAALMQAAGAVNGEALGLSPFYLRHVLRDTLGFRGVAMASNSNKHPLLRSQPPHGLRAAASAADAVYLALNNTSVDISDAEDRTASVGDNGALFAAAALDLVQAGGVREDRLSESAARIVQLKKDLGLFGAKPYADPALIELVGAAQDVDDARNAVRESLTLLKNQNAMLPLAADSERVLFLGPHLNSTALLASAGSLHLRGGSDDAAYAGFGDSVMDGVRRVAGSKQGGGFVYRQGFGLDSSTVRADEFDQIVRLAQGADKIVVALGEHPHTPAGAAESDLHELALDAHQINFVKQLSIAVNKPIAVVLVSGRPRLLREVADIADAVLWAYVPGIHGGLPIAEALYGRINPSGRLPVTYPQYESQSRDTVWQGAGSEYRPQWAFGHGLGYSQMLFSNITADRSDLAPGAPVTLRLTVQNTGPRDQWETVMLYTSQPFRTTYEPELLRLRRFDKILVKQGTAAEVAFTLSAEELAYYTRDLERVVDYSAPVNITVNAFSANQRSISLPFAASATA
ncbi:hypothetical protein IWW48_004200 [Coemansia sp. RSA 1200]|nr:hypothetical protein IWW48_004200 [Coemansia sp. RSA 1200]